MCSATSRRACPAFVRLPKRWAYHSAVVNQSTSRLALWLEAIPASASQGGPTARQPLWNARQDLSGQLATQNRHWRFSMTSMSVLHYPKWTTVSAVGASVGLSSGCWSNLVLPSGRSCERRCCELFICFIVYPAFRQRYCKWGVWTKMNFSEQTRQALFMSYDDYSTPTPKIEAPVGHFAESNPNRPPLPKPQQRNQVCSL